MRNLYHPESLGLITISLLFCISCHKYPEALFTSDLTEISAGESVQFTDQSLNEPITWNWTFEGGTPSFSSSQDPLVTYTYSGSFSVALEATNRGGTGMISRDNYITVLEPTTDVTFTNNTFKEISIILDFVEKSIPAGGSVTYYDLEGASVEYYAETSGKTSSGTQLGELLWWNYTISLTGGTVDLDLDISSDYYFMRITNNGTHVLTPLEVTQGPGDVITEYIAVPNNGIEYDIGYYKAYTGTLVKGYFEDDPTNYVFWANFTFPGTVNQLKELTSNFKKSTGSGNGFISNGQIIYKAMPSSGFEPGIILKEGARVHFPNNPSE